MLRFTLLLALYACVASIQAQISSQTELLPERVDPLEAQRLQTHAAGAMAEEAHYEADRNAILAMAGVFDVSFDFIETVPLANGYQLKERKVSQGQEAVLVIEDHGHVIRLQHILQVNQGDGFAIKHWRQDWVYEPAEVHEFVGHNTWRRRALSPEERRGRWAQVVYQVDDSPRYAAVAKWRHPAEGSVWTGADTWRPLPRRDATTRDDYQVIVGANRHQITPDGWVHEQDNTKTILNESGQPTGAIAREVAINSYRRASGATPTIATRYWEGTAAFWTEIRESWARRAADHDVIGVTLKGEPEAFYRPILKAAEDYRQGGMSLDAALAEAWAVKERYVFGRNVPQLADRVVNRPSSAELDLP